MEIGESGKKSDFDPELVCHRFNDRASDIEY